MLASLAKRLVDQISIYDTGIYSTRIRLQEGEEKIQAEEKNERLLINDDNSSALSPLTTSWEQWIKLPSIPSQPTLQSFGLVSYLTSDLFSKNQYNN